MSNTVIEMAAETHVKMSYMDAIVQAEIEEMLRDERVILMGEDLSIYGDGQIFAEFGPSRVWSTPISETSFTGMAVGAAMTGLRPMVALNIASFMYLASDQIINQASKLHFMTGGQMQVPAVFRCTLYHNCSVAAQHSDRPYPLFMNVPGLKVIAPSTPADMKGLLKSAIRDDDPVVVFEDTNLWSTRGQVPVDPDCLVPIGKADIKREGSDVTVVSISGCLKPVMAAAKELEKQGISAEVVDPRTLVPLDKETILNSVRKTGKLVLVDNAHRTCSAVSEIAAIVVEEAFEILQKPIQRLTTPDVHVAATPVLEKLLYPNTQDIVTAVQKII